MDLDLRDVKMERHIAALLGRESERANELANALESAAAVATERDDLIDRLKAQERQIDALSASLSEERQRQDERALVAGRGKSTAAVCSGLWASQEALNHAS